MAIVVSMPDRYGRPVHVGDIVLAHPLDSQHESVGVKYVVGTIGAFDDSEYGRIGCYSMKNNGQVDVFHFHMQECELILTHDGKLASDRVPV